MNRRTFLSAAIGGAALRQQPPQVSSTPSLRDWNRQEPVQYPDPDIIALDTRFRRYIVEQHGHPAAAFRYALGRRAGMERRRPLPCVERYPEQCPDALD